MNILMSFLRMQESQRWILMLYRIYVIIMDRIYMRKAIQLAGRGWGRVSPNPMVGALIVKRGHIIADGYHHVE